jgi:hypothetical protein
MKKLLILRVGFDNPMNKLQQLKDKTISRFVEIDLRRFSFQIEKGNIIRLSLINRIASMGKHIDLTLSFTGKWKLNGKGFKIANLKMDKFSILFFPARTTKGIRNAVSNALKLNKVWMKPKVRLHPFMHIGADGSRMMRSRKFCLK